MSILSKVRVDGVDYDLMGLGGDVLPVGTEVDIDSTATIPAGWEEVDNKYEIYSTDERCIGRWIDGKPLYRKVLSYSISGQSAYPVNITIPTGYTSAEYTIRDMRGILYGSDYAINLNRSARWTNSDTAETMNLIQTIDGVHLVIIKADAEVNYFNGCDGIVIIEYTKTSDTADSPITKRIKKVSQTMPIKYTAEEIIISPTEPTTDRRKIWLSVTGKNLFDGNFMNGTGSATGAKNRLFTYQNVKLKAGETYTFSTDMDLSEYKYAVAYSTNMYLTPSWEYDSGWQTSSSFTFTPSVDSYLGMGIAKTDGTSNLLPSDISSYHFQVEQSSTATPYEAYVRPAVYIKNDNDVYEEYLDHTDTGWVGCDMQTGFTGMTARVIGKTLYISGIVDGSYSSNTFNLVGYVPQALLNKWGKPPFNQTTNYCRGGNGTMASVTVSDDGKVEINPSASCTWTRPMIAIPGN